MNKFISDDQCDCSVGLGVEYADPMCPDCEGAGKVKPKKAKLRSLYNQLLRRKKSAGL